jgi:hypothetical protein
LIKSVAAEFRQISFAALGRTSEQWVIRLEKRLIFSSSLFEQTTPCAMYAVMVIFIIFSITRTGCRMPKLVRGFCKQKDCYSLSM